MDPFKNHKQYFLAEVQAGAALLGLLSGNRARREANERALRESEQALERQRAARARVEEQKARYAQYQFQNPFEGMERRLIFNYNKQHNKEQILWLVYVVQLELVV